MLASDIFRNHVYFMNLLCCPHLAACRADHEEMCVSFNFFY